ncbi:MAG: twin-arginine translocation signal domain-containing protein, partial [Dehalococcoidales bacterium]|nr:twin-arginine translocation signal domain-containing protein [Dehalococcoidales bacterium]
MSSSKERKSSRLSRRDFLKVSAVTGTALAASRVIKYPQLNPAAAAPETIEEGVITEKWMATSCLNCPVRCATQVRVVNGKAVKVAGNPLSRFSEGEICPRGHIALQVLYDPSRVSGPLKRTNPAKGRGVDPNWASIS